MKKSIAVLALLGVALTVSAANHNTTRSNRSAPVSGPSDLTELIERMSADALFIGQRMIEIENAQDAEGELIIRVEMNITVEKAGQSQAQPAQPQQPE